MCIHVYTESMEDQAIKEGRRKGQSTGRGGTTGSWFVQQITSHAVYGDGYFIESMAIKLFKVSLGHYNKQNVMH